MIEWQNKKSQILYNSRLSSVEKQQIERMIAAYPLADHFWVGTSGSTGEAKWVALSKEAIFESAQAVNRHLEASQKDIWFKVLPDHHVGGLGIWARAYLSSAQVVQYPNEKWNPHLFLTTLESAKATLTTLVPTQIYDLISNKLTAPATLRAIVVGGGNLNPSLYFKAIKLGWKLLPSYGMTECSSQIATAPLNSWQDEQMPPLQILKHVHVRVDKADILSIKGNSLLTGYIKNGLFIDPKEEGWYCTEDRVKLNSFSLEMLGRRDNCIKIGGELVDFSQLENIFEKVLIELNLKKESVLLAMPDKRLDFSIHMATMLADETLNAKIVKSYNRMVMPFEIIRKMHYVKEIPINDLGKFQKTLLMKRLQ